MSRLRWQLRTYISGVILAGAASLSLAVFGPRLNATEDLLVVGILLGLATLALADGARPMLSQPLPILAAGAARYLTQTALVDVAVALQMKRRPFASWWTLHRRDLAQMTGLYLLGAIAAVSADGQPLALVLFAVPMVAMLITLRDSARVREQTRAAILELADLIDLRDPYTHG